MTLCFFSILMIILICGSLFSFKDKWSDFKTVLGLIKPSYSYLLNDNDKYIGFMLKAAGCFTIVLFLVASFKRCCLLEGRNISVENILKALIIWVLSVLLMYFVLGLFLVAVLKTVEKIGEIKNDVLAIQITMSCLMIGTLLFFSCLVEEEIKRNLGVMIVGLIICYFLNLHILFRIVRNPFCLILKKEKLLNKDRGVVIFTSIMIVMLIIFNLYLIVLWTYFKYDGAYSVMNELTAKWDLLYYTIISFTTIGYGDITPNIVISQFVSIIISITSVICLIIFISSVLSEIAKFTTENE